MRSPDPVTERRRFRSHGTGRIRKDKFAALGENVIFEEGARVFHPENIALGENIYIGHNAILKAYYRNRIRVASHVWIGQNCFFHGAGGIEIEEGAGIGPGVMILTSTHDAPGRAIPIIDQPIVSAPVRIGAGSDIGVGSIILPGVSIGRGAIIGAGAVVTRDVPEFEIWSGVPARRLRRRGAAAAPRARKKPGPRVRKRR
jgi:acetyltransferase-like isoleucine patch superfamily enzyme